MVVLTGYRDPTDDSEIEVDFKSENNTTHISDIVESRSKKTKTKVKVKVKTEDGQSYDSGFKAGFGGDGADDVEEGMYA